MSASTGNRNAWTILACSALALVIALGWFLWPQKVKLSADTYDIAIALYRVCNQQDQQGLAKVQKQLDQLNVTADPGGAIAHLQSIMDEAQSGQWTLAMRHTREALDDQTREL